MGGACCRDMGDTARSYSKPVSRSRSTGICRMRWLPYHRVTVPSPSSTRTHSPTSPAPARIRARRRPSVGAEGVVAEDLLGQSVRAQSVPENVPRTGIGLVRAAPQGHEEPGVVVEDGQGVGAPAPDLDVALEVELPELIGLGPFE